MDDPKGGGKRREQRRRLFRCFKRKIVDLSRPSLITATNVTNHETARRISSRFSRVRTTRFLLIRCTFHLSRTCSNSDLVVEFICPGLFETILTISLCRCKKLKRWKLFGVVSVKYSRPREACSILDSLSLSLYLRFTNSRPDTISGKYFAILSFELSFRSNKLGLLFFSSFRDNDDSVRKIFGRRFNFTCRCIVSSRIWLILHECIYTERKIFQSSPSFCVKRFQNFSYWRVKGEES